MNEFQHDVLKKHTVGQSIFLHLFPGILVFVFYSIISNTVVGWGFPTIATLILAGIVVLIPVELGIVLWVVKRSKGKMTLQSVMPSKKLSIKEYILYSVGLIIIMGLIVMVFEPVSDFLEGSVFSFFPDRLKIDYGMSLEYSKTTLVWTYSIGAIVLAILAPVVEEIYFRGYLLPRVPSLKGFDSLFHSVLFACYHFWTPWMIVSRIVFMYPLIYIVKKKQNIYVAIIVHCFVNLLDFIAGFVFILSL